jgi:hypothetical protein
VRAGNELSFIDDGFIASLKARELDGAIVRPANPYHFGQQVQVRHSFTGHLSSLNAAVRF